MHRVLVSDGTEKGIMYVKHLLGLQVITDPISSRSKGYGFVRFGNEQERDRALTEMAGHIISNRPVRVSIATAKKSVPAVHGNGITMGSSGGPGGALLGEMDPSNTTLFIGGLNAAVRTTPLMMICGQCSAFHSS